MQTIIVTDEMAERFQHIWSCGRTDRHSYQDPATGLLYIFGEDGWMYAGEECDAYYAILGEE